ncbi:MAG: ABC transporter permease [Candidatus Tectomicrobia bacterium]|uniref:ABC transporter permease n=1 Tax=Tectimicrobiota bacterium TaxID=2528274 RepID=A0A938AZA9_UNCTE|nr:ABC transporter permease [Candidatus Tectomicrobia bacterium]
MKSPAAPRWLTCSALGLYGFLYAPLGVLIAFSWTPSEYLLRWEGLTWRWYQALWQHQPLQEALLVSLTIAIPTVVIATVIGTLTALALARARFPGKLLVQGLLYLPLIMPSLVLGVALLLLFVAISLPLGVMTIILAHVAFSIPLTTLVILARMQRLDPHLEEAAMDLGADAWTTFWRVTVPLLRPGIVAAALLALPWSLNDFVVTFFVAGVGSTTLPLRIHAMIRLGVSPMVNALGTLLVILPLLVALLGTRLAQRQV